MSLPALPVAFGQSFERASDILLNNVIDEIFSPNSDAARLTVVVVYNHTNSPLLLIDSAFDSGGFSPGKQAPFQIDPKTAGGYRVELHGIATGVTDAHVRYGLTAGDPNSLVLDIVTSNPYVGGNSSQAQGMNGFRAVSTDLTGNANQVDIDVFSS